MNFNWKTVVTGFIVTLILYVIGASLWHISILSGIIYILSPIIGGFTVAYLNNGDYMDNILNGGLASGTAGFMATFIISGLLEPIPVFGSNIELVIVVTITNAVMAFVIGAVLGLIGGIVGILIKGQSFEKENLT